MSEPEVWLRGPIAGIPRHLQPVAHSLLQSREEVQRVLEDLTPERLWHVYNYFDHTDLHAVLAEGRRFEICDRSRLQWRPSGAAAGE